MARRILIGAAGKAVPKAKGFRYVRAKRKFQRYFGTGRYRGAVRGARLRSKERVNVPLINVSLFGKKITIAKTKRGHPITGVSPRGRKAMKMAASINKTQSRRRKTAEWAVVGAGLTAVTGSSAYYAHRKQNQRRRKSRATAIRKRTSTRKSG